MSVLVAILLLGAVDKDEAPSRVRLGAELESAAAINSGGGAPALLGGIEFGLLPAEWLRFRVRASALWSGSVGSSITGGYWFDGGADLVAPRWWGEYFAGLQGGALLTNQVGTSRWLPTVGARAGIDLLLARPVYVGLAVGYSFALLELHFVTLDLRVGLAF